jgi:4-diphosphocytidyl-2-C-methyl-D-erythritol kinase
MILNAPAKINLWLRVLGKRVDGFHDLHTRMVPLDLADRLTVELVSGSSGITFTCSDTSLPTDGRNLVIKALTALREHVGELPGLRLHLEKHVPHGAGLGGGSSDAAAALRGVNELAALGLSIAELARIAAQFGSDVPFFLYQSVCDCTGRGECVRPVAESVPALPLLLAKPAFPVPTPWAYQRWSTSQEVPGFDYLPQPVEAHDIVNDLERPVFEKYLLLGDMKRWLRAQDVVRAALMSGSGSTMIAWLHHAADGPELAERVREAFGADIWTWSGLTLASGGSVC